MDETPLSAPRFCANCGTSIPATSNYCPSCGVQVAKGQRVSSPVPSVDQLAVTVKEPGVAPPAATMTASPSQSTSPARFWLFGVPIALAAIGLLAWAVLSGLPFGGRNDNVGKPSRQLPVVQEGEAATATLPAIDDSVAATTTRRDAAPSASPVRSRKPAKVAAAPAPVILDDRTEVPVRSASTPPPREEPVRTRPRAEEISEARATDRVDTFVRTNNRYDRPDECYRTRSLGYENRGYLIEVVTQPCDDDSSASRSLGRWRIDSVSEEIFRQNSAGRFVRP